MKLPALWIVSAFAAGILLGSAPVGADTSVRVWLGVAIIGVSAGLLLVWRGWVRVAWAMTCASTVLPVPGGP